MNNNVEYRNFQTEFRFDKDNENVTGYAIVFGSESRDMGFTETIAPTALKEADMSDVIATYNHDQNQMLGRNLSGTLKLDIDDKGLKYSVKLPDTTYANDLKNLMLRNDITSSSFAFTVKKGGDKWSKNDKGGFHRTINKIGKLVDISIVNKPAYTEATATLRSFEDAKNKFKTQEKEDIKEMIYKTDVNTLDIYTQHLKNKK